MKVKQRMEGSAVRLSVAATWGARMPGERPHDVLAEVKKIVLLIFPAFSFAPITQVFRDILRLFQGTYPGYRRCNTYYHDLKHTLECLLVTAELLHGAHLNRVSLTEMGVQMVLISALMHDTGYVQTTADDTGTGGKYTLNHISRSIDFLAKYFHDNGFPEDQVPRCSNFLRCTALDVKITEIHFPSWKDAILGKILGTADLIGQMASEDYLRKLPHLYDEFKEGCVQGFEDEADLIKKTPAFWEMIKQRFTQELGQVDLYLRDHFRVYYGIDRDLYRDAIETNIACLQQFLNFPSTPVEGSGLPIKHLRVLDLPHSSIA